MIALAIDCELNVRNFIQICSDFTFLLYNKIQKFTFIPDTVDYTGAAGIVIHNLLQFAYAG